MKTIMILVLSLFINTTWAQVRPTNGFISPELAIAGPVVPNITKKCFAVQSCIGKIDGVYETSSSYGTNIVREINNFSYRLIVGQPFPDSSQIKAINVARYLNQEKTCNKSRHAQGIYSAYDPDNGNPSWYEDSRAMVMKVKEVCIPLAGVKPILEKNPCEVNADCPNSNYRCNTSSGMCYSLIVSGETTPKVSL